MTLVLLPITLAFFFLVYTFYQHIRFKLPPGPRPWPIFGNLYHVKPVMCRCYAEWAQQYGPIISVWFGSALNVVVSNSELAKEVLKEKDHMLADRPKGRSEMRFSRNGQDLIWADYGPHYVKVRKVCTLELFTPKRLEALRSIREDEVMAMVESIFNDCTHPDKTGKSLVMRDYLGAVAFNNITRLVFGKCFMNNEGVINEQGKEFKSIVENGTKLDATWAVIVTEYIPWLWWFFPLEEEAFAKHNERQDRLTRAIMEEHTAACLKTGGTKQHFVGALLTLQKQYDLSDDTVIGLLWDMITAGMDTTAISVEWAMAELIKNPRVQQKAQEELDNVIGSTCVLTETDFANLPYLQCVVKEALRLHPPTPLMLPHKANVDVKLGGYDIPKGTSVHVNVWALARDSATWKNPLEFRPERFLEEDVDMKGHDHRLLPFGAGRRVCPGAQLSINLVTSMLGHLLHNFSWSPANGLRSEEIDMSEEPGLVTYMHIPLQAVPTPRCNCKTTTKFTAFERKGMVVTK